MREIIENQIRDFSSSDIGAAQDYQVLDLGITHKCWQKAVFRINQLKPVRRFKTSVSIEHDELKLTLIRSEAPYEGIEFTRRMSTVEKENLPPKIKSVLESQGFFHLTSKEEVTMSSSGYPRNSPDERMFLAVGYSTSAIISVRRNQTTGSGNLLVGSLHTSNAGNNYSSVPSGATIPSSSWFKSTYNAAHGYSVAEKARLTFTKYAKAKKLLATAGRSKPQGDLIIYFGENSCLSEGVNGAGEETMKLQNAASLKELETYESEIETGYVKATFNYPRIYASMMSASKGFSTPCGVEYGVDINDVPFVEFMYGSRTYSTTTAVKVKLTMRNSPGNPSELPDNDLNILDMKTKSYTPTVVETTRLPDQTGSATTATTETSSAPTSESNHELGPEETILVNEWRDAYIAYNTARRLSAGSDNPLEHFNAFMMHQIEQGNEIEQVHFDLYNSLK